MVLNIPVRAIADPTTTRRAALIPAPDLPDGAFAAVEVAANDFMCGYRPDRLTEDGARTVAHMVLGDFEDITHLTPVSVEIGNSRLFARIDEYDDGTEVSFGWPGMGDLGVSLDQADDMVAKLRDWTDRLEATVKQARMGGAL